MTLFLMQNFIIIITFIMDGEWHFHDVTLCIVTPSVFATFD